MDSLLAAKKFSLTLVKNAVEGVFSFIIFYRLTDLEVQCQCVSGQYLPHY